MDVQEGVAVGRSFAMFKNYHIDGNKEMIAFGMMNIAGSCTSCYLTTGTNFMRVLSNKFRPKWNESRIHYWRLVWSKLLDLILGPSGKIISNTLDSWCLFLLTKSSSLSSVNLANPFTNWFRVRCICSKLSSYKQITLVLDCRTIFANCGEFQCRMQNSRL